MSPNSASSRTPPRSTRTNFRPIARAIERPSDVLPTPGASHKTKNRSSCLAASIRYGEKFQDAFFDFFKIIVVPVENFPALVISILSVVNTLQGRVTSQSR